jgi:hypothetical protein
MQFIKQVMTTEPIDIFAWPTSLPMPIARLYTQLWTPQRVDHIIEMAKAKTLAIEINEVAHVPDETFIGRGKQAGLKFTFGTGRAATKTPPTSTIAIAQRCGLIVQDRFAVKTKWFSRIPNSLVPIKLLGFRSLGQKS